MDIKRIKEILRNEYGIQSDEDFMEAYMASKGIDIGLFTSDFERRLVYEQKIEEAISA